ncbi:MAG: hypothetical protein RBR54_04575 [Sulfurimonas sp.]|jgi:transcriptional regulator with XRE-family HTH domain|nr:hypothetical protein [Sulfurimonas sp.]
MEVYEVINLYLKEKKVSKKEFAKQLLSLEPKLRNTSEAPSETTIYAYLNGRIGIKIELIPYIAEALNIPEQMLFDKSSRGRKLFLKHILKTLTSQERELLTNELCKSEKNYTNEEFHTIKDLLKYAPTIFIQELKNTLKEYRDVTLKFSKR